MTQYKVTAGVLSLETVSVAVDSYGDGDDHTVFIEFGLTLKESKALRKELKAAEESAKEVAARLK